MKAVTQWFSIKSRGQPRKPGWWGVRYAVDEPKNYRNRRYWWDGGWWRFSPSGEKTGFGNTHTHGECWRGLADKP